MDPRLTEAEHYQVDDEPSGAVVWIVGANLVAVFLIATAIGLYLTQ